MRIFRVYIPGRIVVLVVTEIALVFSCFLLAGKINGLDLQTYLEIEGGYEQLSIATAVFIACLYFRNLYSSVVVQRALTLVQDVLESTGVALLLQALLAYVYPDLSVPQRTMVIGAALACVLVPLWRVLYGLLTFRAVRSERLLFLGTSNTVLAVADRLSETPEFGQLCGFVDDFRDGENAHYRSPWADLAASGDYCASASGSSGCWNAGAP